ncbi:protein DESIGUAL 2-like [Andrographis paniculata]|uniref:protein DESIGUAL 2-like n=1 Tax=Andrographis paniculata TaxID=175694 RepID=UPI0021E7769F|nr:protein DESIGUAL 2-like [Andrographis paniculata]
MARNLDLFVVLAIMVLDIVAGILGIEAEVAQNKVQHLKQWIFECRDPSYQAFKLGLAAVVLLCLAHAATNLLGGCIFIRSKEELDQASSNKQMAAASLVMLWLMLGIAFILLISGINANSKSRMHCGISNRRQLSIGGILCFIHGLFAVSYYVSAAAVLREERKHHLEGQENKPNPQTVPSPA